MKVVKKIVGINTSFNKGNSIRFLNDVGDVISSKNKMLGEHRYDFDIIHLKDYNIEQCRGCLLCITKGKGCIIKDDSDSLMEEIREYDGIVFSVPTYVYMMPGILKTFIDRQVMEFHRPTLVGVPVVCVAHSLYDGHKCVGKEVENFVSKIGAFPMKSIFRKTFKTALGNYDLHEPILDKELDQFFTTLETPNTEKKPTKKMIYDFNMKKIMTMFQDEPDLEFWEEKNWNDMEYYLKCKTGIFGKLTKHLNNFTRKMISKSMAEKKDDNLHEVEGI